MSDCTRGVYLDFERGSEHMVVPAAEVAKSLVDDYVISQPLQDQEAGPGMFWLPGRVVKADLREGGKHEKETADSLASQKRWFNRLVRAADDLWTANHRYAQIGDLERWACRYLGLKRDWLSDDPEFIFKCPVCTTLISKDAIVCFACHVILNPEKLKEFSFLGGGPAPVAVQPLNTK